MLVPEFIERIFDDTPEDTAKVPLLIVLNKCVPPKYFKEWHITTALFNTLLTNKEKKKVFLFSVVCNKSPEELEEFTRSFVPSVSPGINVDAEIAKMREMYKYPDEPKNIIPQYYQMTLQV